ncbi:MAG: glycosyltransferase [Bryobacterales bacterium]|nr:glycosyltransferase [Bryobacterales bacterium]
MSAKTKRAGSSRVGGALACSPSSMVLTINRKFVSDSEDASHAVGAIGFVRSAARRLAELDRFDGFLVYARDEGASCPSMVHTRAFGFPAVQLRFHFRMPREVMQDALASAVGVLSRSGRRQSPRFCRAVPIVYHQSNTLLPFQPHSWPFLVTHHGPFASEVCRIFGRKFAVEAFRGGESKLEHLIRSQAAGLRVLRCASHAAALELSAVQEKCLLTLGVQRSRVFRISPPFHDAGDGNGRAEIEGQADDGHRDKCVRLVSAVARADSFKNLSQLVASANGLVESGMLVRLAIFAGREQDERSRTELFHMVSARLKPNTTISVGLSHERLMQYLTAHRATSIFVCTSAYETFGITPLEAMLAGMVTVVPDDAARIGIVDYAPSEFRYPPTLEGLMGRLKSLIERQDLAATGLRQRRFAQEVMRSRNFISAMQNALDLMCAESIPSACWSF